MAAKAPSTPRKKTTALRNTEVKTWALPGVDEVFVQDPLTFFEKNEFLALIARAIDSALSAGVDLRSLITLFGFSREDLEKARRGEVDFTLIESAGNLVSLLTRLLTIAPELLEEVYFLSLSVPRERWIELAPALRRIDDDAGFGIMETFIEQNATVIRDFLPRWKAQAGTLVQMYSPESDTSATSTD